MSEDLLPSISNQNQEQDDINDLNGNYSKKSDCNMKVLRISLIIFAIVIIILIIILISNYSSSLSCYSNCLTLEYDVPETNKTIKLFKKQFASSISSIIVEDKTYNRILILVVISVLALLVSKKLLSILIRECMVLPLYLKNVNHCFRQI